MAATDRMNPPTDTAKRRLIIEPFGGLGNRLLAMISAQIFAAATNRELCLVWLPNPRDCNARARDLFLNVTEASEEEYKPYVPARITLWLKEDFESLARIGPEQEVVYVRSLSEFRPSEWGDAEFWEEFQRRLRLLEPVPAIRERVMELPPHTIGLQIRRRDHWRATRYSPLGLFFQVADQELGQAPDSCFFLATDSPEVLRRFRQRYGTRILHYESTERLRSTTRGLQDAFVDLLTLSRTKVIYASYGSTFGRVASIIHGVPYRLLQIPNAPCTWSERRLDRWHDWFLTWEERRGAWRIGPFSTRLSPKGRVCAYFTYAYTRCVESDCYQLRRREWEVP